MLAQSVIMLATVLQLALSLALAAPARNEPGDEPKPQPQHLVTASRLQLRRDPRSLSGRRPANLAPSAPVKELALHRRKEEKINILLREFPLIYPSSAGGSSASSGSKQPTLELATPQRVSLVSKEQQQQQQSANVYGQPSKTGDQPAVLMLHVTGDSLEMSSYQTKASDRQPAPCFFHAIACF